MCEPVEEACEPGEPGGLEEWWEPGCEAKGSSWPATRPAREKELWGIPEEGEFWPPVWWGLSRLEGARERVGRTNSPELVRDWGWPCGEPTSDPDVEDAADARGEKSARASKSRHDGEFCWFCMLSAIDQSFAEKVQ